jgi:hypothetical protein
MAAAWFRVLDAAMGHRRTARAGQRAQFVDEATKLLKVLAWSIEDACPPLPAAPLQVRWQRRALSHDDNQRQRTTIRKAA